MEMMEIHPWKQCSRVGKLLERLPRILDVRVLTKWVITGCHAESMAPLRLTKSLRNLTQDMSKLDMTTLGKMDTTTLDIELDAEFLDSMFSQYDEQQQNSGHSHF